MSIIYTRDNYTFPLLIYVFCVLSCTTAQGGATIKEQTTEQQSAVVNQTDRTTSGGTISISTAGGNIQPQPQAAKQKMTQLIIKFRNADFDPSRIAYVQELSRDAQTQIIYLRPMSGGAHVFRVVNVSATTQLATIIQQLSKRPEILYVEQDRIMQHQKVQ
jgi:hypothetical protein